MRPIEEQGFVIVAVGEQYIRCANQLTQSLRHWHANARVCLITDKSGPTGYDYVHLLDNADYDNPYANDWQVYNLTPFRETIKLEADMLITSDISHWWYQLRHSEVCISTGCRDWQDRTSTNRYYRRVFDENHLPDVYNAITYWRASRLAKDFFMTVRDIFKHWDQYKKFIRFADEIPSTDLVYAMAADIVGRDRVTQPWASYPRMVHMKQHIAGSQTKDWTREFVWEYVDHSLRINTLAQSGAVHYHIKDWQP